MHIIVDLDGTLCDSRHREHLAQAKEWDAFHTRLENDNPYKDVKTLVNTFHKEAPHHCIVALTGRTDKYRQQTLAWLNLHEIKVCSLLMRPENDWRSDSVVKPELLARHFLQANQEPTVDALEVGLKEAQQKVLMILEDRDIMVSTWRDLGFQCWQVRDGGY